MEGTAKAFQFSWKYADFEIRTSNGVRNGLPYVELVKYYTDDDGRRLCFTLAYWHISDSGDVKLYFVGDRPFEEIADIDIGRIWKQLWHAGAMFQDWANKEQGYD